MCLLTASVHLLQQATGEGSSFQNTAVQVPILASSTITSVTSGRLPTFSGPLRLHAQDNITNGKAKESFPKSPTSGILLLIEFPVIQHL